MDDKYRTEIREVTSSMKGEAQRLRERGRVMKYSPWEVADILEAWAASVWDAVLAADAAQMSGAQTSVTDPERAALDNIPEFEP